MLLQIIWLEPCKRRQTQITNTPGFLTLGNSRWVIWTASLRRKNRRFKFQPSTKSHLFWSLPYIVKQWEPVFRDHREMLLLINVSLQYCQYFHIFQSLNIINIFMIHYCCVFCHSSIYLTNKMLCQSLKKHYVCFRLNLH